METAPLDGNEVKLNFEVVHNFWVACSRIKFEIENNGSQKRPLYDWQNRGPLTN